MFKFEGTLPCSKSLMNRALILKSYFPHLKILGESSSSDVHFLKKALSDINTTREFQLGEGGTSFRFFALRVSREIGEFDLHLSKRLAERPSQELVDVLKQVGVQAKMIGNTFHIVSRGWNWNQNEILRVNSEKSSQFASALLLNCWNLPQDLIFETQAEMGSESYFIMTQKLAQSLGLVIEVTSDRNKNFLRIPAGQDIRVQNLKVEPDMSSAFTLACAAALAGEFTLIDFPIQSLQPDVFGLELLRQMGALVEMGTALHVRRTQKLTAVQADLKNSPDLFPCLAAVCAFADGVSELRGAEQLSFKESHRIHKTSDLLQSLGVQHKVFSDGISVHGNPQLKATNAFSFDPDQDHRMAFAAALFKLRGVNLEIRDLHVVEKSLPEFWKIINLA